MHGWTNGRMDEDMAKGAKMDVNTKSLPKQKTIKSLIYKTQGLKITINENPPTRGNFFDKFFVFPIRDRTLDPLGPLD